MSNREKSLIYLNGNNVHFGFCGKTSAFLEQTKTIGIQQVFKKLF